MAEITSENRQAAPERRTICTTPFDTNVKDSSSSTPSAPFTGTSFDASTGTLAAPSTGTPSGPSSSNNFVQGTTANIQQHGTVTAGVLPMVHDNLISMAGVTHAMNTLSLAAQNKSFELMNEFKKAVGFDPRSAVIAGMVNPEMAALAFGTAIDMLDQTNRTHDAQIKDTASDLNGLRDLHHEDKESAYFWRAKILEHERLMRGQSVDESLPAPPFTPHIAAKSLPPGASATDEAARRESLEQLYARIAGMTKNARLQDLEDKIFLMDIKMQDWAKERDELNERMDWLGKRQANMAARLEKVVSNLRNHSRIHTGQVKGTITDEEIIDELETIYRSMLQM